ncbi:MAG: SHOCT domain-containing protein [Pseudolabrys sp.]|jgi:putative membrane protein
MGYGYGPGWGMMGGWGGYGGYGYGIFGMIIWVIILIAVVALVIWLVRSLVSPGMHHGPHAMPPRSSGLDILEERYARGDINREEYLQKKKDMGG